MKKNVVTELTDKMILKAAQKTRSVTQSVLGGRIGMSQNALSQNMNRSRMSLDMFSRILHAMDYDVVVVDRTTGEPVWKLCAEYPGNTDENT